MFSRCSGVTSLSGSEGNQNGADCLCSQMLVLEWLVVLVLCRVFVKEGGGERMKRIKQGMVL